MINHARKWAGCASALKWAGCASALKWDTLLFLLSRKIHVCIVRCQIRKEIITLGKIHQIYFHSAELILSLKYIVTFVVLVIVAEVFSFTLFS